MVQCKQLMDNFCIYHNYYTPTAVILNNACAPSNIGLKIYCTTQHRYNHDTKYTETCQ